MGLSNFYYQLPADPYENMVSFCYTRTYYRTSFEVGFRLPNLLKMFTWGEDDFVSDPDRAYEGIYRYAKGDLQVRHHGYAIDGVQ